MKLPVSKSAVDIRAVRGLIIVIVSPVASVAGRGAGSKESAPAFFRGSFS